MFVCSLKIQYQCASCCGCDSALDVVEEIIDVDSIFYPAPNYGIKPNNLESTYDKLMVSIKHVKQLLDAVKTEDIASNLLLLLNSNFHEFTYWVRGVRDMQHTIATEFAKDTISADKMFLLENKRTLKKLKSNSITELKTIFQDHADTLLKHQSNLNEIIVLLCREMTYRKIVVDIIAVHIEKWGTSSVTLKPIFEVVKPKLFQATATMIEINKLVTECIEHKGRFKPSEKLNAFLKNAQLSLSESGKKLDAKSNSMKKGIIWNNSQ